MFRSDEDYLVFVSLLKRYLHNPTEEETSRFDKERPYIRRHKQEMNLHNDLKLLAYCLLPDHFHLIAKQESIDGITKLTRRLLTYYVMWFNKKYKRQGVLFESVYKAVLVPTDSKLLALSRYIHLNPAPRVVKRFGPVETVAASTPEYYPYSSYQYYLGGKKEDWLNTEVVLEEMGRLMPEKGYRQFVEEGGEQDLQEIADLILE